MQFFGRILALASASSFFIHRFSVARSPSPRFIATPHRVFAVSPRHTIALVSLDQSIVTARRLRHLTTSGRIRRQSDFLIGGYACRHRRL